MSGLLCGGMRRDERSGCCFMCGLWGTAISRRNFIKSGRSHYQYCSSDEFTDTTAVCASDARTGFRAKAWAFQVSILSGDIPTLRGAEGVRRRVGDICGSASRMFSALLAGALDKRGSPRLFLVPDGWMRLLVIRELRAFTRR